MSDYGSWNIKELRERLLQADINALADSGLLDGDTVEYLITFEEAYEPESMEHWDTGEPAYYAENTEVWRSIVRRELSRNLRQAVRDGNTSIIEYALGFGNAEERVQMDFGDYEAHRRLLMEPGLVQLMYAGMGGGKTMTAVRQAEVWMMLYPNGRVLTNIRSWAEKHDRVDYVGDFPALAVEAAENPDQHTLFVGDEMGIKGNAYGGGNEAMEQAMHTFVRLMRKEPYKLQMTLISQRPTDIHPTLRNDEIAVYAMKEGQTKNQKQRHMVIYGSTTNEACTEPDSDDVLCSLYGIGMPATPPDTNDRASWDWGTKEDWAELGLIELDEDGEASGSEPQPCQHVKDNDEPCGGLVWDDHPSSLCPTHRAQANR